MQNSAIGLAVYTAVRWAVNVAVGELVNAEKRRTVYVAWYTAVNLAVDVPMNRALVQPEEPLHPGLEFYLAAVT